MSKNMSSAKRATKLTKVADVICDICTCVKYFALTGFLLLMVLSVSNMQLHMIYWR